MSRHGDSIFDATQSCHSACIHGITINDESIKCRLTVLVGRTSVPNTSIALVALTCQTANLNSVDSCGLRLLEGIECGIRSRGEVATPSVDDEGETWRIARLSKRRERSNSQQ